MAEVGILIIDDDIVSQQALKNVLDSEGWRVRIVPLAAGGMKELAGGNWSLVIVNIALADLRGPLYGILKELAQAEPLPATELPETADRSESIETGDEIPAPPALPRRLRVLFLIPAHAVAEVQPILEQEGLPYSLKPYHLHDFLEKVSELLLEAGAIAEPIRSVAYGFGNKKRKRIRARDSRRGAMFASREDYQMTEVEMADWERQEEEDRKKREKEQLERLHRG